jgi:hypothetical protein
MIRYIGELFVPLRDQRFNLVEGKSIQSAVRIVGGAGHRIGTGAQLIHPSRKLAQ